MVLFKKKTETSINEQHIIHVIMALFVAPMKQWYD